MALTAKQRCFVDEYLIDLNATQAAIRAKYSPKTAQEQSSRLLSNVMVQAAIAVRQKQMAKATGITPEKVLQRWWELANVDVNELIEYRRDNCRHCWGKGHQYQWTEGEYEKAQREAEDKGDDSPECSGGFGYVATREPNPECPECSGEGRGKIHVHDTRRLSGPARQLYAGVKLSKDGLQVLMEDRSRALENVARHLGMFESRHDVERKRMENERLRKQLDDPDDAPPTPVRVVVEVKDARKPDAEP